MKIQKLIFFSATIGFLALAPGCDSSNLDAGRSTVRVAEQSLPSSEVAPSFEALDYDSLGAPEGTESIHTRVFSNNPAFVPSTEELEKLDNGAEVVAFIGANAYAMHDRIWAVQRMADFPSVSARSQTLDLVTNESTYAPLRCIAVSALGAYNLITDDEVRDALIAASESSDDCVRAAADAIVHP